MSRLFRPMTEPTEQAIQARMIQTLCNMLSSARIQIRPFAHRDLPDDPEAIEAEVRGIAIRELSESGRYNVNAEVHMGQHDIDETKEPK